MVDLGRNVLCTQLMAQLFLMVIPPYIIMAYDNTKTSQILHSHVSKIHFSTFLAHRLRILL